MAVYAGSFAISAVAIRDNRGVGLFVGQDVAGASITGCKIQVRAIALVRASFRAQFELHFVLSEQRCWSRDERR
jgi:hypothetical protein